MQTKRLKIINLLIITNYAVCIYISAIILLNVALCHKFIFLDKQVFIEIEKRVHMAWRKSFKANFSNIPPHVC